MPTGIGYYSIGIFGIGDGAPLPIGPFDTGVRIPDTNPISDLQLTFGGDLTISATGDIAMSGGTQLGQERVLRRLLTAPGDYIWHTAYGAGLPRFVGEPAHPDRIAAITKSQMYRENVVVRNPAPVVSVVSTVNGVVTLDVQYADATNNQPVVLNFSLNG